LGGIRQEALVEGIATIFALSVAYAVFGNVAVYVALARRKVPMRLMWSGTPGYLYRVCVQSSAVSIGLRRFAFSVNVAFVIAILSGILFSGFEKA
jgi:hypothetical protein